MSGKKNRLLRQRVREIFKDDRSENLEFMYKLAKKYVKLNGGVVRGRDVKRTV